MAPGVGGHVNGEAMESLVIRITMWHEDDGLRARLWSDADGRSTAHVASTHEAVLAFVDAEISRWTRAAAEDPS